MHSNSGINSIRLAGILSRLISFSSNATALVIYTNYEMHRKLLNANRFSHADYPLSATGYRDLFIFHVMIIYFHLFPYSRVYNIRMLPREPRTVEFYLFYLLKDEQFVQ